MNSKGNIIITNLFVLYWVGSSDLYILMIRYCLIRIQFLFFIVIGYIVSHYYTVKETLLFVGLSKSSIISGVSPAWVVP